MRCTFTPIAAVVALLAASTPAPAHHAFSAEFDANKPLKLKGTLIKWEMVNPHSWFHLSVKAPDGTAVTWMIEGGSPNQLIRLGVTKNTVAIGTELLVDGYQAKDGSHRANGRDLTFPDGRKLFLGSSGTGAPTDGDGGK